MITKQAQHALFCFYYDQGIQAATKQAGLSKIAKPSKQKSKAKPKEKPDSVSNTLKDVIRTTSSASTVTNLSDKANTYIDKVVNSGVKKLPKQHRDLALKAVDSGKGYLKSKAISALEPLYVGYKALSPEGRKDLVKQYPLQAPKPKSIQDAIVAPLDDVVSFATAPLSISGLAAGARTADRVHKGTKHHYKSIQDAAIKGDQEEVRRLVESDPRIRY